VNREIEEKELRIE